MTAYITGGSRGIGAACVKTLTASGWRVGFTYRKSMEQAVALAENTNSIAVYADVAEDSDVRAAFQKLRESLGKPDALICNAGIAEQKQFQDITDTDWHMMLNTNLMGAVHAVRAVLPSMLHRKRGAIVLVSSMWGQSGASCESHYAASKAALIGLGKSLALELGLSGIRVNCVAPGVIRTDMNAMHNTETLQALAEETPLHRLGTAEEVADSIAYLVSDKASFITGQVLGVTGGF